MSIEENVKNVLEEIRKKMSEMGLDAKKVFMNGNCGNLHKILAEQFRKYPVIPHVISYKDNPHHLVSEIEGKLYDITGETSLEKYIEYVKENNQGNFKETDFSMQDIPAQDREKIVRKMSNMYEYDYDWGEQNTRISSAMENLRKYLNDRFQEK